MGNFADQMNSAAENIDRRITAIYQTAVQLTQQSIQFGSEITGAPGQPVDTGNLRNSWQTEQVSPTVAIIGTNVVYARPIEDGVGAFGPLTLRSEVGGFHSVKKTAAEFPRIVQAASEAHQG